MKQSYQKVIQISKKKACKAARKYNRIRIKADEAILLCKHTRRDILLAIYILAKRMKNPNHYDANKLLQQRIYEYLAKTQDYYYVFILKLSSIRILAWVDASC